MKTEELYEDEASDSFTIIPETATEDDTDESVSFLDMCRWGLISLAILAVVICAILFLRDDPR